MWQREVWLGLVWGVRCEVSSDVDGYISLVKNELGIRVFEIWIGSYEFLIINYKQGWEIKKKSIGDLGFFDLQLGWQQEDSWVFFRPSNPRLTPQSLISHLQLMRFIHKTQIHSHFTLAGSQFLFPSKGDAILER